jgi:hypothetical protein
VAGEFDPLSNRKLAIRHGMAIRIEQTRLAGARMQDSCQDWG